MLRSMASASLILLALMASGQAPHRTVRSLGKAIIPGWFKPKFLYIRHSP
jgi:hypothetical protein